MGNCLVTKLKENVNNPRLITMDEVLIKVLDPSKLQTNPNLVTISRSGHYSYLENYSYIKVSDKYMEFTELQCTTKDLIKFNLIDVASCHNFQILILASVDGKNIVGDVKYLPITVKELFLSNKDVDIKDLGHLIRLEKIRAIIDNVNTWSNLHGTIESFVQNQIANGRTSCTNLRFGLSGYLVPDGVTYQGNTLGTGKFLSWNWDGSSANITLTDLL